VVCSNRSSLPEVAGDAAVLVNPDRAEEMTQVIHNLLDSQDLRNALREKGLKRVEAFDCERAARETVRIYERANRTRRGLSPDSP
jgi:glycosyltransferase involved in cell wall biosynthesis